MEVVARGRPHLAPVIVDPSDDEVTEQLDIPLEVVGDSNWVKAFGEAVLEGGVSSLEPDVGELSSVTTTPSSIENCCLG